MDASPSSSAWDGPSSFRFLADNADLIKFLVIVTVLVGGWLGGRWAQKPAAGVRENDQEGHLGRQGRYSPGGNDDHYDP